MRTSNVLGDIPLTNLMPDGAWTPCADGLPTVLQNPNDAVNRGIDRCVQRAAMEETANRRYHGRHPFFAPVTVAGPESNALQNAFSRDLSLSGIGLLHRFPVELGMHTVTLTIGDDRSVRLQTEILWCQPVADEWYFSGGRFMQISTEDMARLLLGRVLADLDRRNKNRVSFLRRIQLVSAQMQGTNLQVFSRDISPTGLGLFHSQPLTTGPVTVEIPIPHDVPLNVGGTIHWCRPSGVGWYLSGMSFRRLNLGRLPSRTV